MISLLEISFTQLLGLNLNTWFHYFLNNIVFAKTTFYLVDLTVFTLLMFNLPC